MTDSPQKSAARSTALSNKLKIFHQGQNIYRVGQPSNVAYMIKSGKVSIYKIVNNKRVVTATLGAGQIFGEMGVISGEKRTSNADALEYSEVLILDQAVLHTLLLKSPRPVQIITGYLVERVKSLNERITDRPSGNVYLSACQILALLYKAAQNAPGGRTKTQTVELSYVEISKSIKEILLISQLEIDELFDRLEKLTVIEFVDIKGAFYKTDPLLGTKKKTTDYIKDRTVFIPDVDKLMVVARNMFKDMPAEQFPFLSDLEFIDIGRFSDMVGSTPEMIYKKIAYQEIPPSLFFFHKSDITAFAKEKGHDYFQRARKPRMKASELETLDDIEGIDDSTLEDALAKMSFHKLPLLVSLAGGGAREKILANLSRKMVTIVQDELSTNPHYDESAAYDAEEELIDIIKELKGIRK
ncbi:cyclic nucleotide-binding domain-containing protein [Desulfovibrio inopinatus]|uniref:cyclic nucleotide-binding domain-containing protein n=1 Tax=Desulfovibrio inopinatus TaxID=102109 RepID=UPI000416B6D5|nr:cyclic nucleotide-binding domain-containing protein [Desulfovibrio inopinatus]